MTADVPISFDPNRADFEPYGLTCVRWHPSPMRRPDHHNEIELNFLESGSVTYLLGGRKTVVEPRRINLFWAAIPHQIIEHGKNTSYFVATIPLQSFLQWRLPEEFVQSLMGGELLGEPNRDRALSDAKLFAIWEQDLARKDPITEAAVLLEIQARLLRLALALGSEPAAKTRKKRLRGLTDAGLSKVEQMACFIARHYTEDLGVDDIARFAGLHPNYAMNLFQRSFGTTLKHYLTRHRISHAQRLLVTTDESIASIAFASGFLSLGRFNEAFREACKCTPREYRRSHLL